MHCYALRRCLKRVFTVFMAKRHSPWCNAHDGDRWQVTWYSTCHCPAQLGAQNITFLMSSKPESSLHWLGFICDVWNNIHTDLSCPLSIWRHTLLIVSPLTSGSWSCATKAFSVLCVVFHSVNCSKDFFLHIMDPYFITAQFFLGASWQSHFVCLADFT